MQCPAHGRGCLRLDGVANAGRLCRGRCGGTARAVFAERGRALQLRFGADKPFLPSNATTDTGEFIDPKSFLTAEYCGHCHQEAYAEWRQTAHANSFRKPWYIKNVNMLIKGKGHRIHAPLRGLPQSHCADLGRADRGSPIESQVRQRRDHLLGLPFHSESDERGTGSYVLGVARGAGGRRRQADLWRGSGQGDPGAPRSPLQGGDEGFLPHQRVLRRVPQSGVAQDVESLQVAARHFPLRRVAAGFFQQAESTSLLREGQGIHLPDLPHGRREHRTAGLWGGARQADVASLAGRQYGACEVLRLR